MSQFGPASGSLMETRGHIMTAAYKCGLTALVLHWNHSSKLNQRQLSASVARSHAVLALARGYSLTDRIAPGDTAHFCVVGYMEKQDIRNKDATYIVLQ